MNGDGIDDFIIGAPWATTSESLSGRVYLVFGSEGGVTQPIELGAINGTNGIVLNGEAALDYAGIAVSRAGDINGDGLDDLIIGASNADTSGELSGRSYVLFGSDQGLSHPLSLGTLANPQTRRGFVLEGMEGDQSGISVSAAGDFNGDGIDDLIIGARLADANENGAYSGRAYVVFGSDQGLPNPFQLGSLDGTNGVVIQGEGPSGQAGHAVGAAGDFNGDGIDDIILGAPRFGSHGRSYVVFGSDQGFPDPLALTSLNGSNGLVLNGQNANDRFGYSVSGAGDINGDGIDDVIIGAHRADSNGGDAGLAYVVFGSDQELPSPFEVSMLQGEKGLVFEGAAEADNAGVSVSTAGDVNADGIDDLIIGASGVDSNALNSGSSYIVFGSKRRFPHPFSLDSVNGCNGLALNGEGMADSSGRPVARAGDINDDGVDDVIIGARFAEPNRIQPGRSYVVFGREGSLFCDRFEGGGASPE